MKKIYILTAVLALLTLSLNAQDGNQDAAKAARAAIKNSKEMAPKAQWKAKRKADNGMTAPAPTINELLAGIKGMSSVMPPSSDPNGSSTSSGSMRAPLKINNDEYLVGPYTTNDFSTSGYGFPDAYGGDGQQIYIFSDMSRSDFEQYDGDEIVGFRLALAGNSSQTAYLYEFYSWPYSTNGIFENANRHTWSIPDVGGAQPVNNYDDIVITTNNGYIGFTSIIVYNGNSVVTQWVGATDQTTTPTDWIWTGGSRFASNNDGSYFMTYGSSSGGGIITIPGSLFENCTGDIRLVISAGTDSGYGSSNYQIDVNGDPKTVNNENPTFNQFTWTFSSTGTSLPAYLELTCGQWHEFYLDEPIPFNVNDTIAGLYLGYRYWQWGSSNTGEFMYPVAVNPNSTNDGIVSYRIGVDGTTTTTQTLTSWSYADDGNNFPTTWTVPTHYAGELGGSYYFGGSNGANIVIPASDLQGNSTVTVKVTAGKENSDSHTISVNNSSKSLTTSLVEYTWENVNASSGITIHVSDYYVNISKIEVIGTASVPNYRSGWWNENMNGDLAVQLILKNSLPKTDPPTISVTPGDAAYTITATATDPTAAVTLTIDGVEYTGTGSVSHTINRANTDQTVAVSATAQESGKRVSDPAEQNLTVPKLVTPSPSISITPGDAAYTITATGTGTVTLTIGDQTVTGNGTASITIPRTNVDQNITATATAQETGKAVSEPATQVITVPMLPITPTPEITYQVTNASVVITATGEGTVTLSAGGQTVSGEGTVSITIMRSIENQTVTATATAVTTNHQPSAQDTESVLVPALAGTPATAKEGLLRMHLLVVDQFKEEIPDDNSHPERYGYVLKWEPNGPEGSGVKESGTVEVEIQKTEAKVNGYYTLDQIDADVNVGINHDLGLTMDVLTADASMFLPGENPDVLYYQMQGKEGAAPELNKDYLTQLQYMKNVKKYEEMLATSPNKTHQYPANETYHYFNDSEPIVTGIYNDPTSFMTYAPSVSTWGIQRRYFEVDHLDNTYGAPIWKTAVGQVKLNSAVHERQTNQWNSVNWTDEGGNACSLYILDNIEAEGYLPHTGISNVEYEPYMFRVFVESKNGKLRPYTVVPQGDGDHDGEHLVAGTGTTTGPICVWSGYYMDGDVNGMTFSGPRASETVSGQMKYVFTKVKVDRSTDNVVNPWDDLSDPWNDFDTITDPETGAIIKIVDTNRGKANAMFGALDNLAEIIGTDEQGRPIYAPVSEDDLKVFVRFYYVAAGTADGHVPDSRAGGAAYPAGYGTESPGKAPSPWTIVNELRYHGEIVSQTYVNTMGMQSDRPFDGVNIVITRYSDGTTSTTKVLR